MKSARMRAISVSRIRGGTVCIAVAEASRFLLILLLLQPAQTAFSLTVPAAFTLIHLCVWMDVCLNARIPLRKAYAHNNGRQVKRFPGREKIAIQSVI